MNYRTELNTSGTARPVWPRRQAPPGGSCFSRRGTRPSSGSVSCGRLLVCQPVEGHGRRPRLTIGAKGLARERLVVLAEAPVGELREGVALEPGRSFSFSRVLQ